MSSEIVTSVVISIRLVLCEVFYAVAVKKGATAIFKPIGGPLPSWGSRDPEIIGNLGFDANSRQVNSID